MSKHQARFSQLPRAAVIDQSLSSTDFKVLAIIGLYLNHDREAWPSQDTIAEVGGMSRRTVIRAIKSLEQAGYIESKKKYPNRAGTHKCYRVVMSRSDKNGTSRNATHVTYESDTALSLPIRTSPVELTTPNGVDARANEIDLAFDDFCSKAKAHGWPVPKKLSPARKTSLQKRVKENTLGGWSEILSICARSDFLCGRTARPFTLTIDWLLKPANILKVLEGNYDNRASTHQPAGQRHTVDDNPFVRGAEEAAYRIDHASLPRRERQEFHRARAHSESADVSSDAITLDADGNVISTRLAS